MSDQTWIIWHPAGGDEGPEDGRPYIAATPEEAAQKWAKDYDQDVYPLTSNEDHREIIKVVAQANDPVVRTYSVWASISVDYFVNQLVDTSTPTN